MVSSRLLAYFSEHAFSHWLVGRALGIRFTTYGFHGTSHPRSYPPGARFVFSGLPFLSARVDPQSLGAAVPAAHAAVYASGTVETVISSSLVIPGYCLRRGLRTCGFFVGVNLWSVPLLSEAVRPRRGPAPGVAGLTTALGPPRHSASSNSTFWSRIPIAA